MAPDLLIQEQRSLARAGSIVVRGRMSMTGRNLGAELVARLSEALRSTLPANGEKRKNEESDFYRQVARSHPSFRDLIRLS